MTFAGSKEDLKQQCMEIARDCSMLCFGADGPRL